MCLEVITIVGAESMRLETAENKQRSEDDQSLISHAKDLGVDIARMKNVFLCRNDNGQIFALDHFENNAENEWRKGEIKMGGEKSLRRGH